VSLSVQLAVHGHLQSRAAIARLGAKQDGVLRNHSIIGDGSLRDTVVFSIIASASQTSMELLGRCGRWLDTDTVTVQGFMLRLDTTSKGWGLLVGHQRGLSHGTMHLADGHESAVDRFLTIGSREGGETALSQGWARSGL